MSEVFFHPDVVRVWEGEVSGPFMPEAGGVLIGYWTISDQAVVTRATYPGPNSRRGWFSFEPDDEWDRQQIREAYTESEGCETYLGEWHSHLAGVLRPSGSDAKTIRLIANYDAARNPRPLSLIVSRDLSWRLRFAAYRYDGAQLVSIKSRLLPGLAG